MQQLELIKQARNTIFIPPSKIMHFEEYEDLSRRIPDLLQDVFSNYRCSLEAVLDTASLPFLMACGSVHLEVPQLKAESSDLRKAIAYRLCEELCDSIQHQNTVRAHHELLRQSAVLLWGVQEAFFKDLISTLLDTRPFLIDRLLKSESSRKIVMKSIPISDLEKYAFDVSENLGHILCQNHSSHSIYFIKAVLEAVWPSNRNLHESLSDPLIWQLHEKRNAIVHGAGTECDTARIIIHPEEYQSYLDAIMTLAVELMKALIMPIP